MNVTSQDSIESNKPVFKCKIIEADNTLKLHKSEVQYYYNSLDKKRYLDVILLHDKIECLELQLEDSLVDDNKKN